jgi:hypothetical protein
MDMIASRPNGRPILHQRLIYCSRYYGPDDIDILHRTLASIGVRKDSTIFCEGWVSPGTIPSGILKEIKVYLRPDPTSALLGSIKFDTNDTANMVAFKIWGRYPNLVQSPVNLELWMNMKFSGDGEARALTGTRLDGEARIPSHCDHVRLGKSMSRKEKIRRAAQLSRLDATKQVETIRSGCCASIEQIGTSIALLAKCP